MKNYKREKRTKMNKNFILIVIILIQINYLYGFKVIKIFSKNLISIQYFIFLIKILHDEMCLEQATPCKPILSAPCCTGMKCTSVKTDSTCAQGNRKFGCYCMFPRAKSDFETYLKS